MNTEKTRVGILTEHQIIERFLVYLFQVTNSGREDDFVVKFSSDPSELADFRPTILFIDYHFIQVPQNLWQNLTPGGIAIFPSHLDPADSEAAISNYFRKIVFKKAVIQDKAGEYFWDDEEMFVPLQFWNKKLAANLDGLKQLAQAMAIYQEEFSEATSSYSN